MTEVIYGNPLWTSIDDVPCQYPWLSYDENCDVAIVGGGVTGALAAYRFAKAGINVVVINSGPIGFNSTSINTSILQYEIDNNLIGLSSLIGKQNAVKCFQMCADSLNNIEQIVKTLNQDVKFVRRDCILYTDNKENVDYFNKEFLMRKHNGFEVDFLDKQNSRDMFSFPIEAGILSKNLSAEIDSYLLTHALLSEAEKSGARIFENTTGVSIDNIDDNTVEIKTSTNKKVTCKKVILATGYEQENYLNCTNSNKTTFCIATKPINNFAGYENRAIIRDDKNPYYYIRTTSDNRIIIGGLDSNLINKDSKIGKFMNIEKIVENKYHELEQKLNLMFCAIPDIEIEYKFAGTFSDTNDCLPIIGEHKDYPNIYFDFCCGSNGILYAEMASNLLLSLYQNNVNKDIYLFAPDRKTL